MSPAAGLPTRRRAYTIPPMMNPYIELSTFQGTLEELISAVRRLIVDITRTPLVEVVTQTRNQVLAADNPSFDPFMKISGLLFVKSRTLLPTEKLSMEDELLDEMEAEAAPEEEPTKVREKLARQYSFYREVGEVFDEMREERGRKYHFRMTGRTAPRLVDDLEFMDTVTAYDLMMAYILTLRRALEDKTYHVSTSEAQNLARRITEVFDFIFQRGESDVPFSTMLQPTMQRPEAILTFLAIVFLIFSGKIVARQQMPYSEIYLKAVGREET